jgi:hypothetical protein
MAEKTKSAKTQSSSETKALRALPASMAVNPDFPVADVMQEARELEKTLKKVGAVLLSRSDLPKTTAHDLSARLALLDRAEDAWQDARKIAAPKDVRRLREEGETLRKDALAALRYFARDDSDTQIAVESVAHGTGDVDLVDDLRKLSALVRAHASILKKAELPKKADKTLADAAKALADAAAERATDADAAELIDLRNRAYWHLRDLMDTIRAAGRYVFRNDARKLTLFRATSSRARAGKAPRKPAPKTPTGAPADG